MGNQFRSAMEKAGHVQSENTRNPDREQDGTKLWTDVGIFYANNRDLHERVTSIEDRVRFFKHYRKSGGEFLKGYSPFIRRMGESLDIFALDTMRQVNPDGSELNMKGMSEDESAAFMEKLKNARVHFELSANTFCPSNYPLYEVIAPCAHDNTGRITTHGKYARVSDHLLLSSSYWHFSRFRRFPGSTPGTPYGYTPWNFDIDFMGLDENTGEGSTRASQSALAFITGNTRRK